MSTQDPQPECAKSRQVCAIMITAMTSTRKRLTVTLLAILAVIGGLLAAGYAAAPTLLELLAARYAGELVDIRELDIESVGIRETRVSTVRINTNQFGFKAQQAVVRYTPWPFAIREVLIDDASLDMESLGGGADEGGSLPAPLPFPIRVETLTLSSPTPWGRVSIPATVATRIGASGGFDADIQSRTFSIRLQNPDTDRHVLELRDADGAELLSMALDTGGDFPLGIEGRIQPPDAARWAANSGVLPDGLAAMLSPFEVDGTAVDFKGSMKRDGGVTMQLDGELRVRDNRDDAERLFESLAVQAGAATAGPEGGEEAPRGYLLERAGGAWSGSGNAVVSLSPDAESSFSARQPEWRWDGKALSLSITQPKLQPLAVGAAAATISASGTDLGSLGGNISLQGASTDWWPEAVNHYDATGSWSWNGSSLHASGDGTGISLPDLSWTIDSGTGNGSIEITTSGPVAALESTLANYTQGLAKQLDVMSGDLDGRLTIRWSPDSQQSELNLTAGPVDANLDAMEIRGMRIKVSSLDQALNALAVEVSAPTLMPAAGTVAEDFEMKLRLSPPELHVDSAGARLFGGKVSLRPVSLNLNDDSFTFQADIDGLSLERVMALLELESTELTGDVAGPVRVVYHKGSGIELNEGNLHSVHPGVLRFKLTPDSEMTAEMENVALRALRDFQYQELNASILYKPSGEYRITARIVGKNPNVLNGHPIALNPTIEGRLPALFRAFFLTGDFSEAIIERLRKESPASTTGETSTFQQD